MSDDSSMGAIALMLSPSLRIEFEYKESVNNDPLIRQIDMRIEQAVCFMSAGSVAQIFFIKAPFLPCRRASNFYEIILSDLSL